MRREIAGDLAVLVRSHQHGMVAVRRTEGKLLRDTPLCLLDWLILDMREPAEVAQCRGDPSGVLSAR